MPIYALATIPLIHQLKSKVSDTVQIWYADDVVTAGKLSSLRKWWDNLTRLGTPLCYYANASQTWLIVKGPALTQACDIFSDTHINITSEGRPYLGVALGSKEYIRSGTSSYTSSPQSPQLYTMQHSQLISMALFTNSTFYAGSSLTSITYFNPWRTGFNAS